MNKDNTKTYLAETMSGKKLEISYIPDRENTEGEKGGFAVLGVTGASPVHSTLTHACKLYAFYMQDPITMILGPEGTERSLPHALELEELQRQHLNADSRPSMPRRREYENARLTAVFRRLSKI